MLKNIVKRVGGYSKYVKLLLKKREFKAIFLGISLVIILRLQGICNKIYYSAYTMKFLGSNKFPIIKINNALMKIDLKDKGISKDLMIYKKREFFSTDFIKNFINEDDFILEIGANKGYYVLLEAKIAKKGKIYAIEPIKENYCLLEESIKLNSFNNITLFPNLALSDDIKEKIMYFYDKQNWCSFTQNPNENISEKRKISTLTLAEFVKRTNFYPTLLRMDVEGHEYEIIKGGIDTLKKAKNLKIFVEMHPPLLSKEKIKFIMDTLQNNNFKIIAVFQEPTPDLHRFKKIINYIYERVNIQKYGKIEISNYKDLEECLLCSSRFSNPYLECFFEKKNIN